MAITISDTPDVWSSAYRPIEFIFITDKLRNATPGEVDIPILFINQSALGVFVTISSQFSTRDLQIGEALRITSTDNGLYVGTFRVLNAFVSSGVLVAYIDTEYVGDETGGLASRTYDNLRLVADVAFASGTTSFPLQANELNQFVLNLQDIAARQFIRTFDEMAPGLAWGTLQNTDLSICQAYGINVREQYTFWENGVPYNSDDIGERAGAGDTKVKGYFAVDCIHPYHKEEDGAVVMDWDSNIKNLFIMADGLSGVRFLTWASRTTQKVGLDDDFYLSFLLQRSTPFTTVRAFITTYFHDGSTIGTVATDPMTFSLAGTINVGPSVIPDGVITSFVSYYTVVLLDALGNIISEAMRLNIDRDCAEIARRIYWRNKMGGIDQYTMKGREVEVSRASRQSISRNYMPVPTVTSQFYGSWMQRGVRVDPNRGHFVTSELIRVDVLQWLNEDCFESADHSTVVRDGWWTPIVVTSTESMPVSTNNVNQRFILEYFYGVDNLSQRA